MKLYVWREATKTKPTLRLEGDLIEVAKEISKRTGKSVSELVADYFSVLESREQLDALTPRVRSLRGSWGQSLDEQKYKDHLVEKHL